MPAGGKDVGQIHFHSVRESKNAVLDTASVCVLRHKIVQTLPIPLFSW